MITRAYLLALGSGLALAASHAPVELGPLALAVPMLLVASLDAGRLAGVAAWRLGAVASAVGHGLMLWWLVLPAGYIGWSLLVLVHVGWWALLAALVRWLPRTPARPLLVAVAWVGLDAVRGIVPLNGFAWGTLGAATVDLPWLASLARVAGEKAMTLAVVVLSVAAWEAARGPLAAAGGRDGRVAWGQVRDALPAGRVGAAWMAGTALVVTLGTVEPPAPTGTADVLLVQPAGFSSFSGTARELDAAIAAAAVDATARAIARDGVPDLTVWPESTIDADPANRPELTEALTAGGRQTGGRLLVGANLDGDRPRTYRNTLLSIDAHGDVVDEYQKRRLVPFGEYVPFRAALEWFPPLEQVPRDAIPGDGPNAVQVGELRVATAICFETLFGGLVRENVLSGDTPADLVVAATNDASFGRFGEARQHIAQSQLRALETGRWVAHAAISGQSAFIDPDGRIHDLTGLYTAAAIRQEIDLVEGRTPYLVTGDWLAPVGMIGLAVLVVLSLGHRRRALATPAIPMESS